MDLQAEHSLIFAAHLSAVVFLGLMLGSFTTALVYRVPKGLPWIYGPAKDSGRDVTGARSYCPSCATRLGIIDLIPVFSWLLSRGKCRHCKAPIPKRYPLIELGVLIASLVAYAGLGFGVSFFFVLAIIPFLVALLVIDIDEMILPNQLVFVVALVGVLHIFYLAFIEAGSDTSFVLFNHFLAALLYGGLSWFLGWFMTKMLKKEALGFGDVKFFAAAGLWLGINDLAIFCLIAGVLGIVFALSWQALFKQKLFPFGPALITSLYLLLVFEGSLLL